MVEQDVGRLRVRTPEGVSFTFHLATPVLRGAAWCVDKAAVSATWTIVSMLISLGGLINSDFARGALFVSYFILSTGYGIVLEWVWNGQTLGKRLLRLRVMDERGLPLRFSQVVVRNVLRAVDSLPLGYLLGGTAALLSRKAQRLGDVAAATVVIREPKLTRPDLSALELAKYNSLRGQRHLAARLRANISPALAYAALQALARREQLEADARLTLFAELAEHFRSLTPLPPEVGEGISDEQFVRNVVEVIFGAKPAMPATPTAQRPAEPDEPRRWANNP